MIIVNLDTCSCIIKYIMFKWDVLLVIHNFSELKSLTNNAKIRSSLKFLLNTVWIVFSFRSKCTSLLLTIFVIFSKQFKILVLNVVGKIYNSFGENATAKNCILLQYSTFVGNCYDCKLVTTSISFSTYTLIQLHVQVPLGYQYSKNFTAQKIRVQF